MATNIYIHLIRQNIITKIITKIIINNFDNMEQEQNTLSLPQPEQLINSLNKFDKNSAQEVISSLEAVKIILLSNDYAPFLPHALQMLPLILKQGSSKQQPNVRTLATEVASIVVDKISPNSTGQVLSTIFDSIKVGEDWQTRVLAITLLTKLADLAPMQTSVNLSAIVPELTPHMNDVKKNVKDAAVAAMSACCDVIGNKDIEHMTAHIIRAIMTPSEVPELMHKLAGVVFVQSVKSSALAMVSPLLLRGLNANVNATKRQSAVIIENMSKLVDDPVDAMPFLPTLLPSLAKAADVMSDPEARNIMERALGQLQRLEKLCSTLKSNILDVKKVQESIRSKCNVGNVMVEYLSYIICSLTSLRDFNGDAWSEVSTNLSYCGTDVISTEDSVRITGELLEECKAMVKQEEVVEEDDDAEVLCDCNFTLAYGTKILLHNTNMKLKRGHTYGLISDIQAGKSTFMRSLANGSVEGFPDPSQVRCAFVSGEVIGELSHLSVVDYILSDEALANMPREEVVKYLESIGFGDNAPASCSTLVSNCSGGWKKRVFLTQAMLKNPDILLADNILSHLDIVNMAWVKRYIQSLKGVTIIMVAKDQQFLNDCCTDIIKMENLKIHQFRGNLDAYFVKYPEDRKLFQFNECDLKLAFPPVTQVQGVKSKSKALIKLNDCTFTYPGNSSPTIYNISAQVSMASKIGLYGPNGGGKSTTIKLITGEIEPQTGTVEVNENCRVAYISQHAFHHIEHHMDKTPSQYVQWRFSGGVDKEGIVKLTMIPTEEEKQLQQKPFEFSWREEDTGLVRKANKVISEFTGVRKESKSREYEYEVKFKDGTENLVPKSLLVKQGFEKKTKEIDMKIAQTTGLNMKALTTANIEAHFKNCCNLDPEYVSHHRISQLADGIKALVAIGASVFFHPHVIIIDEPTNFLSGNTLIGFANALKQFEGGVVVVTHDKAFAEHVTTQTWSVNNGRLAVSGEDSNWMNNQEDNIKKLSDVPMETVQKDRFGNETEIKIKKVLSKRDEKLKLKEITKKLKNGEELDDDENDLAIQHNLL